MYLFVIKSCEVSSTHFSNIEMVEGETFINFSSLSEEKVVEHPSSLPSKEEISLIFEKADYVFFFEPLIKGKKVDYQSLIERGVEEKNIIKNLPSFHSILSSLPEREEVVFIDFSAGGKNIVDLVTALRWNFRENTFYIFEGGYSAFLKEKYALDFNPYDSPNIHFENYSSSEKKKYISFVEELCYITQRYLSLNFHKSETNYFNEIDDYFIFNLQSFPLKSLIEKYRIYSPYEFRRDIPIDEFIISEKYRSIITEYLCKTLARISVNSEFPISRGKNHDWYDEKYYIKMREYLLSL